MSYSFPVCAVSSISDRYVYTVQGTEREVISEMALEQGESEDCIRSNYEIEECDVEVPDDLVHRIVNEGSILMDLEKELYSED